MTEPLYKYYAIDYYGTGEGRTIFLQISRNNCPHYPGDHFQKRWEKFVDIEFYLQGAEELEEREFLDRYTRLLPNMVALMLREKSLTIWQTHYHFNRS